MAAPNDLISITVPAPWQGIDLDNGDVEAMATVSVDDTETVTAVQFSVDGATYEDCDGGTPTKPVNPGDPWTAEYALSEADIGYGIHTIQGRAAVSLAAKPTRPPTTESAVGWIYSAAVIFFRVSVVVNFGDPAARK